jgi:large-conductance mechanosensitive channel
MQIILSLLLLFLIIGVIIFLGKTACRKAGQEEEEKASGTDKKPAEESVQIETD